MRGCFSNSLPQQAHQPALLLDMGLEDYLITSIVNGIPGQRLVRRL